MFVSPGSQVSRASSRLSMTERVNFDGASTALDNVVIWWVHWFWPRRQLPTLIWFSLLLWCNGKSVQLFWIECIYRLVATNPRFRLGVTVLPTLLVLTSFGLAISDAVRSRSGFNYPPLSKLNWLPPVWSYRWHLYKLTRWLPALIFQATIWPSPCFWHSYWL